jgi:hypothetical protein
METLGSRKQISRERLSELAEEYNISVNFLITLIKNGVPPSEIENSIRFLNRIDIETERRNVSHTKPKKGDSLTAKNVAKLYSMCQGLPEEVTDRVIGAVAELRETINSCGPNVKFSIANTVIGRMLSPVQQTDGGIRPVDCETLLDRAELVSSTLKLEPELRYPII